MADRTLSRGRDPTRVTVGAVDGCNIRTGVQRTVKTPDAREVRGEAKSGGVARVDVSRADFEE